MSLENVPEIPCLEERETFCPEGLCPFYRKNEDHIKRITWGLRKREWGFYRALFQKSGIDISYAMICDLLINPKGWTVGTVEGSYFQFTEKQKQFGDYIAGIRKRYIDEHDNPIDPYEIRCPYKREKAFSHT